MKYIPLLLALLAASARADVAFLAAPRTTGWFATQSLSQLRGPYVSHADAKLIIKPEVGEERVLVDGNVLDFSVSLDAQSILYTKVIVPPPKDVNAPTPLARADVFRITLATRAIEQLTNGDGWNCQPVETVDGIAFLSNRDGWKNPHEGYQAFTIYKMGRDGTKQQRIWHAGLGGVFGLSVGSNGRLYFASGENQGFHGGNGNSWSIWSINPDGSDFAPEFTGLYSQSLSDWPVISTDGSLVFSRYYDTRTYGALWVAPVFVATPFNPGTMFGKPLAMDNPGVWNGYGRSGTQPTKARFFWERRNMFSLIPEAHQMDWDGVRVIDGTLENIGMYSHPWPTPGNGVYCTWTGNEGDELNLGVYEISDVRNVVEHYTDLVKVVDEPNRHEWMGKPVVPFAAVYGADPPVPHGVVADVLPLASPFGVIGTSSVDINEWVNGETQNAKQKRVTMQPDEAEYVRVLAFMPTTAARPPGVLKFKGPNFSNYEGLISQINERTGFFEQLVPLKKWRKPDGSLYVGPDPQDGSTRIMRDATMPDSSWKAEVPANQPWSVQLLDAKKQAIPGSTAQTWHQVISREQRTNCQGCHAHWKPDPTPFGETGAAQLVDYPRYRLRAATSVVYERDIVPLGLNLPQQPWTVANGAHQSYNSGGDSWEDALPASEAEVQLVRAWQDTGFMAAGSKNGQTIQPADKIGPYADTADPTGIAVRTPEHVYVGAFDQWSGIASVTVNGVDVTADIDPETHIWTGPASTGPLDVVVTDGQGNVTRPVAEDAEELPPDNSAEIAALHVERDELTQAIEANQARIAEIDARLAEIE